MRRLFNMLVNNVREHFMIYLALWLLLAIIDLVWLWFSDGSGSRIEFGIQPATGFIKDFVAVFHARRAAYAAPLPVAYALPCRLRYSSRQTSRRSSGTG